MDYRLHLGGTTALREAGHVHDVTFGARSVHLYGGPVPGWLRKLATTEPLTFHSTSAFDDSPIGIEESRSKGARQAIEPWWKQPLRRSVPERAILEALDELPDRESFDSLDRTFEGLVALRPRRLTEVLEVCTSVKAKRLFFVFAERHGHPWLEHIDTARIDLGKGDRSLVKGGRLHPTWRITVPSNLLESTREARDGG